MTEPTDEPIDEPRRGRLDPALAAELPGLGLRWLPVAAGPGPSSAAVRARLAWLSDRRRGLDAVALRTRPIPRAYRTLFRQLGLDPDLDRPPAEAVEVERLIAGGLRATERIADACLLAVVETGVPVRALAATGVDLATFGIAVRDGALVVADADRVHAGLFEAPLAASLPDGRTPAIVLYAIAAPGVPTIHVEEALWLAADALDALDTPDT